MLKCRASVGLLGMFHAYKILSWCAAIVDNGKQLENQTMSLSVCMFKGSIVNFLHWPQKMSILVKFYFDKQYFSKLLVGNPYE